MLSDRKLSPLGYAWLARRFQIDPIPHFVESFTAAPGVRLTERNGVRVREIYPHTAHRLTTVFEHLAFALKREGLHLQLLRGVLPQLAPDEVTAFVCATPTGANARRIAHLYESFSGRQLPLPDLAMGNYVPLADPDLYFTGPLKKLARWRINHNLLHTLECSLMLRRTPALAPERDAALHQRCAELVSQEIDPNSLRVSA
jgi:hypothetical protein